MAIPVVDFQSVLVCFPHILDETKELKHKQKNVILLQSHHFVKKSQQYIILELSAGITHQATRTGNSYILVYLQLSLPVSVIFPLQTNASPATTKCCYTLEAEEIRIHSLKETRFWINRQEKNRVRKETSFETCEKRNYQRKNFREYSYLNLRKKIARDLEPLSCKNDESWGCSAWRQVGAGGLVAAIQYEFYQGL